MSGRATLTYQTDPRIKDLIDTSSVEMTQSVVRVFNLTDGGPVEALQQFLNFFLIHHMAVVIKMPNGATGQIVILHPEMDDLSISMEPIPRLTLTKFLPMTQKEDKLVIGEDNFKFIEGAIADIDWDSFLTFLGFARNV